MLVNSQQAIIELVGLAGTGKSTLLSQLHERSNAVVAAEHLKLKDLQKMPLYLRHSTSVAPFISQQAKGSRRFSAQELKDILYLNCWHNVLRKQMESFNSTVVVDQGAIFRLATLHGFGPASINTRRYQDWQQKTIKLWANTLTAVVWLEAPNDLLLERVADRRKYHVLKDKNQLDSIQYLKTYKSSLEHITAQLQEYRQVSVIRLDTSALPKEQIAQKLMERLELAQSVNDCVFN